MRDCISQTSSPRLNRRASVKARMRPMAVVEVDVAAERSSRLVDAVIGPQIHLLVFDSAPEALEEHVIAPRAPADHGDRNLVLDQDVGVGVTRELAALVRVEDLRIAMTGQQKLNGEYLPCFAHAPQRVPTHRQQLPSHPVRGLHERLGN